MIIIIRHSLSSSVVAFTTAGGPSPALFLALMCTVYMVFGLSEVILTVVFPPVGPLSNSGPSSVPSTTVTLYSVTLDPPSSSGGSHDSVSELQVVFTVMLEG